MGGNSATGGHLAMSGSIFGCHNWERILLASHGMVEARDTVKNPTMHRVAPSYRIFWSKMSTEPQSRSPGLG